MARIVRCDVCHEEVLPEESYHSEIRYWDGDNGVVKVTGFDTCPGCFEWFKIALKDILNRTRELGDKKW